MRKTRSIDAKRAAAFRNLTPKCRFFETDCKEGDEGQTTKGGRGR
jgi:hypothetical protein